MSDNIIVSIIVPIYNVEEYLKQCLDSLVDQTLKEIEVLMVDDGSTDLSGEIAAGYAEKYDNFHLFNKLNEGQGKARNYALPFVKGKYLAFLDSDDFVSDDAYEKLYNMSENGERDIIVGNVKRYDSKGFHNSSLHKKIFRENIKKTHITEYPELIYDTTVWNKLFKMEFWKENDFKFPEGVLYEDIPVTFITHFKSNSTAILTDVIYYWRRREGLNKSATQRRDDIDNFRDRLNALEMVDKFINDNVLNETLLYYKYYKWVDLDLKLYINKLNLADNVYITLFIPLIQRYLKTIPKYVFKDLKALDRIKYYLIKNDDIKTLLQTLDFEKNGLKYLKVVRNGDKYFGKFPFKKIPHEYFEMTREFNVGSIVRNINQIKVSDGILDIEGYFYIPHLNFDNKGKIILQAKIVNTTNDKELSVNIENKKISKFTRKLWVKTIHNILRMPLNDYSWGGYNINIDLNDPKFLELGNGTYKIIINLKLPGINRDIIIGSSNNNPIPKPYLTSYNNIIFKYNTLGDLYLIVSEKHSGITNIFFKNNSLHLEGWFDDKKLNNELILCGIGETKISLPIKFNEELKNNNIILNKFPNSESFSIIIPNEILMNLKIGKWFLKYSRNNHLISITGNKIEEKKIIDRSLINLYVSSSGNIIINKSEVETYLISLNWEKTNLKISICLNKRSIGFNQILDSKLRFVSKKLGTIIYAKEEDKKDDNDFLKNNFVVKIMDGSGNLFPSGEWEIYADYNIQSSIISQKITVIENKNFGKKDMISHKYQPAIIDGFLGLKVDLIWPWESMTPMRRKVLERYIYPLMRYFPINKKRIIFESYWRKKYVCNPRYLYEYIDKNYPEYECIWVFNDESIKINGNGKKVRFNTLKYFYYMATAKYFVNNVNFPDFYKKRKNAVEIQTMHGTPLKTIGLDVKDFKTEESMDKFVERCKRWDYLIVSSDKVADIAKRCFLFENKFLKVGYPRIDEIFRLNTSERAAKIKEELKIPENKKVILYAPTWRVKNKFDLMLDLEKMKDVLSKDNVLLMRLHPFSFKGLNKGLLNDFVIDVTGYESIEKLYVISDVLITDYSSVMFDYGVLNKPMIFFAYDLNRYKNNLRNFNLNFEKEAPGPIVSTSDEVIAEIINMDTIKSRYSYNISEFNKKYCQYEKGNSCKSIFDSVF